MTTAPRRLIVPRISAGLWAATLLTWVPPVAVVASRLTTPDLPRVVPTHWGFSGTVDSSLPLQSKFWIILVVTATVAVVLSAVVLTAGDNISRGAGAVGLGAPTVIAASFGRSDARGLATHEV